jgi:hypothetical protein
MPRPVYELLITCPQGHRLGKARVDLRGRRRIEMEVASSTTAGTDGLRLDRERGKLIGQCPHCPAEANAWTVPARGLAGLFAAVLAYGSATASASITGLRDALHAVIPAGDPEVNHRRRWFDQINGSVPDAGRYPVNHRVTTTPLPKDGLTTRRAT